MKSHHIISSLVVVIMGLTIAFGAVVMGGGTKGAAAANVVVKTAQVRQVVVPSGIEGVPTVCAVDKASGKILTCSTNAYVPVAK
jgi:hypothetical protein